MILDLNNPRTDPLGTVAAMKADPALASIPPSATSRTSTRRRFEAARDAGVDEVMARSAFSGNLPAILARAQR